MPETVLEMLLHCISITWLLSLPTCWVDVDELACPLKHPTACNRHTRLQSFLLGAALSHHVVVGGGAFPRCAKPPSLDIRWSVDHLGNCVTESYMA
jgi:hypothetical protein